MTGEWRGHGGRCCFMRKGAGAHRNGIMRERSDHSSQPRPLRSWWAQVARLTAQRSLAATVATKAASSDAGAIAAECLSFSYVKCDMQ